MLDLEQLPVLAGLLLMARAAADTDWKQADGVPRHTRSSTTSPVVSPRLSRAAPRPFSTTGTRAADHWVNKEGSE